MTDNSLSVAIKKDEGGILYTSSYTRKRGKFYHLVFEYIKNKKKTVKSKSSKTDNEELAEEMLKVFEEECRKFFGISEKK